MRHRGASDASRPARRLMLNSQGKAAPMAVWRPAAIRQTARHQS
jgi:hypothetical protein